MNKEAMYKLSYGLFVLTAKEGKKDNGCIINTAIQDVYKRQALKAALKAYCSAGNC